MAGLTADEAIRKRIAARYSHFRHRSYVRSKLRWDPLFAAVAPELASSPRALLDVGCGLGLCGQYLRERGFRAPYRGIDLDARKIREARGAAERGGVELVFDVGSADALPDFSGDVALLDVLHYMPAGEQQRALVAAASRVPRGGLLLIRNVLREATWRFRATVAEERFARALRWMRFPVGHYPSREELEAPLAAMGFVVRIAPLWGRTPFNSYLIVARRDALAAD